MIKQKNRALTIVLAIMCVVGGVRCVVSDEPANVSLQDIKSEATQEGQFISAIKRWDLAVLDKAPRFRWVDSESPIRSLLFEGEIFEGKPTEVFAFYATPGTLSGQPDDDSDLPGVVLLHGGGGTAFSEWVELWAQRGYAAIAMDLGGKRPAPPFDAKTGEYTGTLSQGKATRKRLQNGGPLDDHQAKFFNIDDDPTNDWQYHAVAAGIRAHSLLRSFPEVDAECTGVTGISWGGYLTCLVASVDDRFNAAVPVYGCGFLHTGESVQRSMIDRLMPGQRRTWIRLHDPSAFLSHCRVPMFFVNGTNDKHYPLRSYAKSYGLVKSPRTLLIRAGMKHSHVHGWAPEEIGRFMDHYLRGAKPLVSLGKPFMVDGHVTAKVEPGRLPITASLQYTADSGLLVDRVWKTVEARIHEDRVSALVPNDATIWSLTATDDTGSLVSSEVMFRDVKTP